MTDWRHILLYAKGNYRHGGAGRAADRMEDLRTIVGREAGIERKWVSDGNVYDVVRTVFLRHANPHMVGRFLQGLFSSTRTVDIPAAVCGMLDLLALVAVKDRCGNTLVELGEPDPAVLPVRQMQAA